MRISQILKIILGSYQMNQEKPLLPLINMMFIHHMLYVTQEWYDEKLTWDPADFNGLKTMRVPSHLLWKPDIVLYNRYIIIFRKYFCTSVIACYIVVFFTFIQLETLRPSPIFCLPPLFIGI